MRKMFIQRIYNSSHVFTNIDLQNHDKQSSHLVGGNHERTFGTKLRFRSLKSQELVTNFFHEKVGVCICLIFCPLEKSKDFPNVPMEQNIVTSFWSIFPGLPTVDEYENRSFFISKNFKESISISSTLIVII